MERLYSDPSSAFRSDWRNWAWFLGNGKQARKSPEQWVPIAESLAMKYDGVLPYGAWLSKNGYSGLHQAMSNRPELFAHITQSKPRENCRAPEQWVRFAEELSDAHGGILPCFSWLVRNGYGGLAQAVNKYHELFTHIEQEFMGGNALSDWVSYAESLAKQHNGYLPGNNWINANKPGLYHAMRKRPDLFIHLKQDSRDCRSPEAWVAVANRLADENDGILPCWVALTKQGHGGLVHAMRRRPDLFNHFIQDKIKRTSKDWLSVAERIARDHEGALPCRQWLMKHGYRSLCRSIEKYPALFVHIKRSHPENSGLLITNLREGE